MLDFVVKNYMFILFICSCINMAIFLERFFVLRRFQEINFLYLNTFFIEVRNLCYLDIGKVFKKLRVRFSRDVPVLKLLLEISRKNGKDVVINVDNFISMELPRLEVRMSVLFTITSILPLLGILGTVLGMIDSLAYLKGSGEGAWQGLLGGMWFALSSTAVSLIVVIPSICAYNYLIYKTNFIFSYIKSECVSFVKGFELLEEVVE